MDECIHFPVFGPECCPDLAVHRDTNAEEGTENQGAHKTVAPRQTRFEDGRSARESNIQPRSEQIHDGRKAVHAGYLGCCRVEDDLLLRKTGGGVEHGY